MIVFSFISYYPGKSKMDSTAPGRFNRVYSSSRYYYGLEVRPEFSGHLEGKDLSGLTGLDLGCGEGRYALFLASRGCSVTAVDRSRAGLSKLARAAAEKELPVSAVSADIAEFEFPEAAYDIIVAATVLDHLEGGLRKRTIGSIKSALKPGGLLYANVFTEADPGCRQRQALRGEKDAGGVSDTAACIAHYFGRQELRAVFSDLRVIDYYEGMEPDHSHGRPHVHGWACLLARKPA
jgi:SAM-dependent methyltransferase